MSVIQNVIHVCHLNRRLHIFQIIESLAFKDPIQQNFPPNILWLRLYKFSFLPPLKRDTLEMHAVKTALSIKPVRALIILSSIF